MLVTGCGSDAETAALPELTPEEVSAAYIDAVDLDPKFERELGDMRDDTIDLFGPKNEGGLPPGALYGEADIKAISDEIHGKIIAQLRAEFITFASKTMDQATIDTLKSALADPDLIAGLACHEDAYFTSFAAADACRNQHDVPDAFMAAQDAIFDAGMDFMDEERTLTLIASTQCDLMYRLANEAADGKGVQIHDVEVKVDYRAGRKCEDLAAERQAIEPGYQPIR